MVKLFNSPFKTPENVLNPSFSPTIPSFTPLNLIPNSPPQAYFYNFYQFNPTTKPLDFSVLAKSSPIYYGIDAAKISLYDINGKFYLLGETPHNSQVIVELQPEFSLNVHKFHYLFILSHACQNEKDLYIYASQNGNDLVFQREGENLFFPMNDNILGEKWLVFPESSTDNRDTIEEFIQSFQNAATTNTTEMYIPDVTISLDSSANTKESYSESFINEHFQAVERKNTEDFRTNQENVAYQNLHTNTVEYSEKQAQDRSISSYVSNFQNKEQEETSQPHENPEINASTGENYWSNTVSFYQNILFSSLMKDSNQS